MISLVRSGVSKRPNAPVCNDIVGFHNNYFWLLDGATPPVGHSYKSVLSLYLSFLSMGLFLNAVKSENSKVLLYHAIQYAKDMIQNSPVFKGLKMMPRSTAVVVHVDGNNLDYTVLGDSSLFISDEIFKCDVVTDSRLSSVAVDERDALASLFSSTMDDTSPEYQQAYFDLVSKESQFMNQSGGYWIAADNPLAAMMSVYGCYTLESDVSVVLMSDGLSRLFNYFDCFLQPIDFVDYIRKNDSDKIFKFLRYQENSLQHGIKDLVSRHDDASFIFLSIQKE